MSQLKRFKFSPDNFRLSLGADIRIIQGEIEQGICECWELNGCHFITRVEQNGIDGEQELCVVAAEGENLIPGCRAIVEAAQNARFASIRYHTKRPGLVRALHRAGIDFQPVETVYRMEL